MLTLASLFDGAGTAPYAAKLVGIKPLWSSEIEPYPLKVTAARLPEVVQMGDITKINGAEVPPVGIIVGGSPCFPAGTLVLTDKGLTEIEQIRVGDMVLTHMGRWRKVTDIGAKEAATIILKGNHYGLECTPNHPIYAKDRSGVGWVRAADMSGRQWCVPTVAEPVPYPIVNRYKGGHYKPLPEFSDGFFYFIGRWLGDGWVRDEQRSGRPEGQRFSTVCLCDSYDKLDELKETVKCVSDRFSVERTGTCVKIKCNGRNLCDFLTENFGKYAHGKTIPAWVMTMPEQFRNALLKGILDSDGCRKEHSWRVSTVSKKLAFGIRLLAESLGFATSVYFTSTPETTEIEGRTVSQRSYYTTEIRNGNRHEDDSMHRWYKVKKIVNTGIRRIVYNMTVEEDNSYTADGIVVHNCQDLSVAGAQKGLAEGTRSNLFYEMIRIIKEMREATNGKKPRFVLWENVPGAFSSQKGYDFYEVIKEYCRIADPEADVPEPPKRSTGGLAWQPAGSVVGDGWSLAWRVFDSQFWGVPQRRKRIYLIIDLGSERASEILFERKGLRGDPPQEQEKGQAAAGGTGKSLAEADIRADSYGCDIRNLSENEEKVSTLAAKPGGGYSLNFTPPILQAKTFDGRGFGDGDVVNNITGDHENRITDYTGLVREPVIPIEGNGARPSHKGDGYSEQDVSCTLNSVEQHGVAHAMTTGSFLKVTKEKTPPLLARHFKDGTVVVKPLVRHAVTYAVRERCGCEGGGKGALIQTDVSGTLRAYNDQAVFTESSFGAYREGFGTLQEHGGTCGDGSENIVIEKQAVNYDGTGIAQTLDASYYKGTGARNGKEREIVAVHDDIDYLVRRLTPTECARLQGFPDWWEDGVRTSDSASYKMWGNGMTLTVVEWILGQIEKEEKSNDQT